jgi:hemolysin activation/secretion protein
MKSYSVKLAFLAGFFFLSENIVLAAGPDAGSLQQNLQRQIENEQNSIQMESQLKKKEPTPTPPSKNQTLIEIKGFKFSGNTFISDEQATEITSSFINRQLTLAQINEAAFAIDDFYKGKGRIAQSVVPPQQIKDGIVEIKILEGRVGKIAIEPAFEEDPPRISFKVVDNFISYYNSQGQLIDLDALERSLTLLNELPGIHVEGALEPGQQDGTSNIMLTVDELSRVSGRVDLSNYGSASTGVAQAIASINLNDLASIGDGGTIDIIGSEGSIYGQGRYYIPGNADGLRVGLGASILSYNTLSSFSSTNSKGTANSFGFYSNYALERTAKSNKTVNFNIENRVYYNTTDDIEVSHYVINSATLGIVGNRLVGDANWLWSSNLVVGTVNIMNPSQAQSDQFNANISGIYGKLAIYSSLTQPLPLKSTNLVLTLNGQLATTNLNTSEQLFLGGPYAVRAYPVSQGGGSQGAIITTEINHTFPNNIQIGAFFDLGYIQQYKNTYINWQGQTNAGNYYNLYATGLSAKYRYKKKAEVSGVLALRLGDNPLFNQSGQQLNVDNNYNTLQFWLKGSYYF